MKVLWAVASSFVITTCFTLSGCGSSRQLPSQVASTGVVSNKPAPRPTFGQPILAGQEHSPHFALEIPVTNPSTEKVKATLEVKGAPSEVLHRLSGLGAGQGVTVFTICEVTRKRLKPIVVNVKWRRGAESGVSSFTVSPRQTNTIRS